MKFERSALVGAFAALGLAAASAAHANLVVSAGYHDMAPCCGNPNALANPGDDGFIGTRFTLAPGKAVILFGAATPGLDGRDMGLADQTVSLDLDGKGYAFQDKTGVLAGYPAFGETLPRTRIAAVSFAASVPEPGTWALMLLGVGFLGAVLRGHVVAGRRLAALEAEPT